MYIMDASTDKLAKIFKILSVDARVRIIQLLNSSPMCVNALSSRLDITQGAVSQHLRILRDTGIVISEKRGYYVHYRLNRKLLEKWGNQIGRFLNAEVISNDDERKETHQCVRKNLSAGNRKT